MASFVRRQTKPVRNLFRVLSANECFNAKTVHLLVEAFALAQPDVPILYVGVSEKIKDSVVVADHYIDHWRGLRVRYDRRGSFDIDLSV